MPPCMSKFYLCAKNTPEERILVKFDELYFGRFLTSHPSLVNNSLIVLKTTSQPTLMELKWRI